jgi:tol-pal system protein YbgF
VRVLALLAVALALAAGPATAQSTASVAELVVKLEVLEQELRALRGELEQQRFRQRQLEEEVARLRGQGLAAPAPAAPGTPDDPALGGTGTLGGGPRQPGTVLDTPATGRAEPPPAPPAPVTGTGAGVGSYEDGMALLQAGRYAEARAQLDAYVAANPDGPNAAEAAFWSAETLYVEGNYQAAAAAFAANYRAFGANAPRAPDSLLKVAMSLNQLGDASRACQTLDELARRYPDLGRSLEAAVGRERARAGCG